MGSQQQASGSSSTQQAANPPSLSMGENPEIWKAAAMADHFEKIQKLQIHQVSAWEKIQKFGRPPPWLITSRRSRSSPIQFPDAPTSAESLDTRSTAVDSPPLLALRLLLPKLPEQPIPRRERSSGSTSARNQMSMLMVNPSVLVPQTRLESMLSLEMSLVILLRLMKKNSSRSLKDVQRRMEANLSLLTSTKLRKRLKLRNSPLSAASLRV